MNDMNCGFTPKDNLLVQIATELKSAVDKPIDDPFQVLTAKKGCSICCSYYYWLSYHAGCGLCQTDTFDNPYVKQIKTVEE